MYLHGHCACLKSVNEYIDSARFNTRSKEIHFNSGLNIKLALDKVIRNIFCKEILLQGFECKMALNLAITQAELLIGTLKYFLDLYFTPDNLF